MDTRGIINADWERLRKAKDCGWWKYSIRREGGYPVKTKCGNWDCDECSERMITELIGILDREIQPQSYM